MHPSRNIVASPLLAVCLMVMPAAAQPAGDPQAMAITEAELLAVLRSEVPAAEKAIACKRLAICGSSAAVPELAKLLPDLQLSSWSRIALEAIPGEAADESLRAAAAALDGRLLVGMLNSIGVRRDANAVALLTDRLQSADVEVASAAAVALGHIGDAAATRALRDALASAPDSVRSAIAEGCVLCAERLWADGQPAEATAIYDEVRTAEVPLPRVIEATRGAILTRGDAGIPLLLEQVRSEEKAKFRLALGTARELPGGAIDQALADEIDRTTPARAALIIQAMADRPATVILSAVLNAADDGPLPVRLSAIAALQRVGDASCLPALLSIALDAEHPDLAKAAKETLAGLAGDKVDEQIVARLSATDGQTCPLLLELIGQRRIDAVPELLKALDHDDGAVRRAALVSLGETVALDRLTVLISSVVTPKYPEDVPIAQQALKAASIRMPDREACAVKLIDALRACAAGYKAEAAGDSGGCGRNHGLAATGGAGEESRSPITGYQQPLVGPLEWGRSSHCIAGPGRARPCREVPRACAARLHWSGA